MSQTIKASLPNRHYYKIFTIRMPLCLAEIYLPTHCFGTERLIGRGLENIVYEVEGGLITGYFNESDIVAVGARGLAKLKDSKFVARVKRTGYQASQTLWGSSLYLEAINLTNFSATELLKLYTQQIAQIREVYAYFNLSSPAISQALEGEIDQALGRLHLSPEAARRIKEIFLADQPPTMLDAEARDFAKLVALARANHRLRQLLVRNDFKSVISLLARDFPRFFNRLIVHREQYGFFQGYVNFQTFDLPYYLYQLRENLRVPVGERATHLSIAALPAPTQRLPQTVRYFLKLAAYFSADRMEKRIYYTRGLVALKRILDEVARRLNQGADDVCYLLLNEVRAFLEQGTRVRPSVLASRKSLSILLIEDRIMKLLVGTAAQRYRERYLAQTNLAGVTEVKGTIGNPGLKQGRVKLIADNTNLIKKMAEMKPGSILITSNTRPDMILACRKAAAIVTNEGGILSHAALVSREFGIPCVIGTRDATRVFKDNDLVEVDANNGVVRLLQRST